VLQPRGPAAAVILDEEQVAAVGEGRKRFPVVATVNGHTWRTTVTRMGGEYLLGLNKEVRAGAQAEAGDAVDVEEGDAEARARYEALSYTHRKEYARWIAEAKREETRERRVVQALEMLKAGKTRS
jgi:hypothetical protein